jgi:cell division protease FtsH
MRNFKLLLLVAFLLTPLKSEAFLINILQELVNLSAFNAYNRQLLYQSVTGDSSETRLTPPTIPPFFGDHSDKKKGTNNSDRSFTFANLAGEIPEDIREIVEFIDNPERFTRVGAKRPKGILLYGPPGTGKTSIARAIAGEAGAEFFHASGSEFVEVYVGIGPQRVRELFEKARQAPKALIFIDEIDAIGSKRSGEGNSEYRNTLNELLNQMDGFKQSNITVIAATNRPEDLDSALLRPGRFDRLVEIGLPNAASRIAILRHYCSEITYLGDLATLDELAIKMGGFSGADIKNLVNEAAVFAARENVQSVAEDHMRKALQKTLNQKRR